MANPEHLAILKQDVDVWNKWREENPDVEPDLSDADLSSEKLTFIDLSTANLMFADLRFADFSSANFRLANLSSVNFAHTNLQNSDFNGADLYGAHLNSSNIAGSDMMDVIIGYTSFDDLDLSSVRGLESVSHESPSTVGIDTPCRAKGYIPEVFLRGCGVPDQMIEYARSLTTTPIQYYSSFISYSHKDEELARRIRNDLQASGVRCWFAPHDLKIGDRIRPTIDESLRVHDKLLLILSEHSVQSDWVEHEVEHALERERIEKKSILFPVRLDESVMDSTTGWAVNVRRQRHIGDFTR